MTDHRSIDQVLAFLDCWPGRYIGAMSCGLLTEEAEEALAAETREVPHFQLRTAPPFQLNLNIFLSSLTPNLGPTSKTNFLLLQASWGPILHPAADLLWLPVLFAFGELAARPSRRAGRDLAQRSKRAERRQGVCSLPLAFSCSVSRPAS